MMSSSSDSKTNKKAVKVVKGRPTNDIYIYFFIFAKGGPTRRPQNVHSENLCCISCFGHRPEKMRGNIVLF